MKPVPVVLSPVLISSGEEELLIWFVVVQEVTKNRITLKIIKKIDNSPESSPLVLMSSCVEVDCTLNPNC